MILHIKVSLVLIRSTSGCLTLWGFDFERWYSEPLLKSNNNFICIAPLPLPALQKKSHSSSECFT